MGMSASQARFLSLTARKNNVEFEGQQINQQRTTLSNESATYYSMLCNMEVPVPPSIDDYTKVTYTFNDGAMTNTLISLLPDKTTAGANNRYVVNYVEEWQDDYAIVPAASSMVEKKDSGFAIGSSNLRKIGNAVREIGPIDGKMYHLGDNGNYYRITDPETDRLDVIIKPDEKGLPVVYIPADGYTDNYIANEYTKGDNVGIVTINGRRCYIAPGNPGIVGGNAADIKKYPKVTNASEIAEIEKWIAEHASQSLENDDYAKTLSSSQKNALLQNEEYLLKMVQEKTGDNGDFYIRYVLNSTTGSYDPYLYAASELNQEEKYNGKNLASIPCYSLGSTKQTREILHKEATIEKDSSGRYVAITINLGNDPTTNQPITRTYALTTTTSTDEEAYNDAMNEYNYKQHEYDHRIQEINAKLEVVQQQDKQLELKLKQLDTEENAISTEMDAVKKVISKNVESSFKTFSA